MREDITLRLRGIARRAGFADAPPAVVAAILTFMAVAVAWAAWRWWPRPDAESAAAAPTAHASQTARGSAGADGSDSARTESLETTAAPALVVDVVGEVRRPGVYSLSAGSRLRDAVDAAGGATGDADTAAVNLAAKASDGQQIFVPAKGKAGASPARPQGAGGASASGLGGSGAPSSGPININSADAGQLDSLPGVGPSTAAKIVADREANGPYGSTDDLGRVPGIGPKKLEQLKPMITVQ